jgi:predicted  nucleic acid-binding Zn-ribbon protein
MNARMLKKIEVVKTVNMSDEFVNLNSKIGNDVRILETFSKNSDQNILKLHAQKEHLYKQSKTNREKINRALDAFDVDTKRKLQSNFDREMDVIMKRQNQLLFNISDLKNCQRQIESILDVDVKSNIYFFLFQKKQSNK